MLPADEPRPAASHAVTDSQADAGRATAAVPGAGGVVFDKRGRVLVLRHVNGDWVFPKGHLEGNETLLQAALREVSEEAGVSAVCPEPDKSFTTSYRNAMGVQRQITWFALTTDDHTPNLTEDLFPEALFLQPEAAHQRLTFDADRQLLARMIAEGHPRIGSQAP